MENTISNALADYEKGKIGRRTLIQLLAGLAAAGPAAAAPPGRTPFHGVSLNHVAIFVHDLARSRKFYQDVFGLPFVRSHGTDDAILGLGKSFMGIAQRPTTEINHFCIGVENFDISRGFEKLQARGLNPEKRREGQELYFRDPDGLLVQVSSSVYRG